MISEQYYAALPRKMLDSGLMFIPKIQSRKNMSSLLVGTLNCLMDHLRFGKWISYSYPNLTGVNMSWQWFACFLIGLKLFHVDKLLTPQWLRSYWKRSFLSEGTTPKLASTAELTLLVKYNKESVLFDQFCSIFTALIIPSLQD